jgi:hypothetical protein
LQIGFAQNVTQGANKSQEHRINNDSLKTKNIDRHSVIYTGVVLDSATREPIERAVVYLMGVSNRTKDLITKSTVTNAKGQFEILVPGDSKLEISCLGYKLYSKRLLPPSKDMYSSKYDAAGEKVKSEVALGRIFLAPDLYNADEVVVRARINMYKQNGDTTSVFPKLAKTMEGDALIEVLRQIPGFRVEDDGSIYENGRRIERTYVNNTLLFGQDPKTAFMKLTAQSALAIDTYEEEVEETEASLENRPKEDRTRRVANVTTTRKIDSYVTLEMTANGGFDKDRDIDGSRNKRYGLDGEVGIYKVGKQLTIKGGHNNLVTRPSWNENETFTMSGNPKYTKFDVRGFLNLQDSVYNEKLKRKIVNIKGLINSYYTYDNTRNLNKSRSTSVYFPSINFDSQIVENINESKSKNQRHSGYFSYSNYKTFPMTISITPNYSKSISLSSSQNATTTDGVLLSKTNNKNQNESKRYGLTGDLRFHRDIYRKSKIEFGAPTSSLSMSVNGRVIYNKNEGDGLKNYELTDVKGTNLTVLNIESDSPSTNVSLSGTLTYTRSRMFQEKNKSGYNKTSRFSIGLGVEGGYVKDKEYSIAFNQATGEVDNAYSGDYVRNNKNAKIGLNMTKEWKSGVSFQMSTDLERTNVKSDETLPDKSYVNKNFNKLVTRFSLKYNSFGLSFSTRDNIPYVGQLSNILDYDNPMSLSAGNPNLESGKVYDFSLRFSNRSFVKRRKVTLSSDMSFSIVTDPITMIRRYFKESSILPEYGNYEVVAGATLSTPMNVGSHISASGSVTADYLLQNINTSLKFNAYGNYSNPFSSIDNELLRNKNMSARMTFEILSTPTRKIRINVKNSTTFSWQKNDKYQDRSRTNDMTVGLRLDFLTRLTFTPSYTNSFQKAYTTGQTIERNALNLSLGTRIFRKRNGLLSINAYNIFNDTSGYYLTTTDQLVSESWSQKFARFYSISFQYKFNSLDHSKNK